MTITQKNLDVKQFFVKKRFSCESGKVICFTTPFLVKIAKNPLPVKFFRPQCNILGFWRVFRIKGKGSCNRIVNNCNRFVLDFFDPDDKIKTSRTRKLSTKGLIKMKNRKNLLITVFALIMTLMFTACGSKYSADYDNVGQAPESAVTGGDYGWDGTFNDAMDYPAEVEDHESYSKPSATAPQEESRKIIKRGSMTVETLDYTEFISDFESSIVEFGGYIETAEHYGRTTYNSSSARSAEYTVRLPADKYDSFINVVGTLGTVTRSNHSVEDVTLSYVDIEARLASLVAERDSFMELMDRAQTIEEILNIQSYLTDVNYQIESYTSQLNTLKSLVSYSTVTVSIQEVERVTPQEPKTVWERISINLDKNIYDIKVGFTELFVMLISSLPYLLIFAVFAIVILLIVIISIKAAARRQKKYPKQGYPSYAQGVPPVQSEDTALPMNPIAPPEEPDSAEAADDTSNGEPKQDPNG